MRAFAPRNEIADGRIVCAACIWARLSFLYIAALLFRPDERAERAQQTRALCRSSFEVRRRPGNVHTSIPPFLRFSKAPPADAPALSGCNISAAYADNNRTYPGRRNSPGSLLLGSPVSFSAVYTKSYRSTGKGNPISLTLVFTRALVERNSRCCTLGCFPRTTANSSS